MANAVDAQQMAAIVAQLQSQVQQLQSAQPAAPVRVQPSKPDIFTGDRYVDAEEWLFKFTQWAELMQVPEPDKVKLAATYLRNGAALWWRAVAEERVHMVPPMALPTWEEFKNMLVDLFQPVNFKKQARDKLSALRQTKSVALYNSEFTRLILAAGNVTPTEQLDKYIRGLKDKVRVHVELSDPTTLIAAMQKASTVDNIMWRNFNNRPHNTSTSTFSSNTGGQAPMELGAMTDKPKQENQQQKPANTYRVPGISKEEFARCRKEGLCLKCKQKGHTAKFCMVKSTQKNGQAQ